MLDSGGGGGGVSTPWYDYALPAMWQIVGGQDTETLWKQASGWKNTTDLTSLNLYNLKEYKDQLAQAWPPERSEASSAYMAELDKLIASVQETHDAASANYDAVVSLALAVSDAKYKLKPLYEEYQSNQQKLADYNQQVEAYNSDATAMPQPSPGPPPVPNGRQDELNDQARSIMYSVSSEVTTAGSALKPPAPYQPPVPRVQQPSGSDQTGSSDLSGGGGMLVPPVIPPVRPAPAPSPPAPPPPPQVIQPQPTGIGQGPILGGVQTLPPPPPPPGTLPAPSPPVIQPPPVVGPPPPGLPKPPGLIGPGPGLPSTSPFTGGKGIAPLGGMPARFGTRAMPPGGVIGGPPGAGLARPGATAPMSRVNPAGGMIGGQAGVRSGGAGSPARGTGAPGTPSRVVGTTGAPGRSTGAPVGRTARRRDAEDSVQHWDPDNPWETAEGVAPVVTPPAEPGRHEPGPAIGQGR